MLTKNPIRRLAAIVILILLPVMTVFAEDAAYAPIELSGPSTEPEIFPAGEGGVIEPDLVIELPIDGNLVQPMPSTPEDPGGVDSIPKALTLGKKETYVLRAREATFTSSKPSIVAVDQSGVITARKSGTAKITVKSGKKTVDFCKVTVRKPPSKVTVKPDTLTMETGEIAVLTAKLPARTASHSLIWKSSDESVATVDGEGHVSAINVGTARISVRTFNKKKASCLVTVNAPSPTESPTPQSTEEPTVEPTPEPTTEPTPEPTPELAEGWTLTQYPDDSGSNGLCYSLVNQQEGALILVDGGNPENADRVRNIIEENGGKVKAWFLTHYHADHIGAFNALYSEYRDRIETIYVNPLDWDTFEPIAKAWDSPEAFRSFLDQTASASNIVTLYRGDELDVDGIHIQVFNAFDEHVRELSTDWPNDSSLVMKFSFFEDSLLILGDLSRKGVALGQYLLDTYGPDAMHADYVQAGHHGNWGQPIEFYAALKPRVIFQDAPEWLMTGEQYDAKDLRAWCDANGIEAYDYRTAPNCFTLK